MGVEVEFRVDLLYGTSVSLQNIQDAFENGLTGRDMDFVDPDSRVLLEMINVTLPSKLRGIVKNLPLLRGARRS